VVLRAKRKYARGKGKKKRRGGEGHGLSASQYQEKGERGGAPILFSATGSKTKERGGRGQKSVFPLPGMKKKGRGGGKKKKTVPYIRKPTCFEKKKDL